jgi:hypothetical protein
MAMRAKAISVSAAARFSPVWSLRARDSSYDLHFNPDYQGHKWRGSTPIKKCAGEAVSMAAARSSRNSKIGGDGHLLYKSQTGAA